MTLTSIVAQSHVTFALTYHLHGKYGNHQVPTITARHREVWYISRLVFLILAHIITLLVHKVLTIIITFMVPVPMYGV